MSTAISLRPLSGFGVCSRAKLCFNSFTSPPHEAVEWMDISFRIREFLGKIRSLKQDMMNNLFSVIPRSHSIALDLCHKM
jgi:hypothetical protein